MDKPNCYTCAHRGTIPGDAHSCCCHPATGCVSGDLFGNIEKLVLGQTCTAAIDLGIRAKEHGVRMGWFMWPRNFDPVWLESCSGYEPRIKGG
jgi:hypothetical protein